MLLLNTGFVQNAWSVCNLENSMAGWIAMGVGPFFVLNRDYPDALYRGQNVPLSFRAAMAQAGNIQIELIEQTSSGPSAYRDSVASGQDGFHHMCKITDHYDQDTDKLRKSGIVLATEIESDGIRACYADTRPQIGCMLELIPPAPLLLEIYDVVSAAAADWRGDNPVRDLLTTLVSR